MRYVIGSVLVLLGCCALVCLPARQAVAQLPPEMTADRYLVRAERLVGEKDYRGALGALDQFVALQKEHNLSSFKEFHFKVARVAFSAGAFRHALDAVTGYLKATGQVGEFYGEAVALLEKAELMMPIEPEMVVIPEGRYQMGCVSGLGCNPSERSVHEVMIGSFGTVEARGDVHGVRLLHVATGRERMDDKDWGRGRHPVINVSWDDAAAYTEWLSAQTGKRYRLPSEAEWEYAARAGTTTMYSWGDEIGSNRANCDGCGSRWDSKLTASVGSFGPNAWGLYDMHGNVSEWVQDCWNNSYQGAPADGSAWESGDCSHRVLRGGSWSYKPRYLRAAYRHLFTTGYRSYYFGFRVARTVTP